MAARRNQVDTQPALKEQRCGTLAGSRDVSMDPTGYEGRSITGTAVKEDEPPRLAMSESGQLLKVRQK